MLHIWLLRTSFAPLQVIGLTTARTSALARHLDRARDPESEGMCSVDAMAEIVVVGLWQCLLDGNSAQKKCSVLLNEQDWEGELLAMPSLARCV